MLRRILVVVLCAGYLPPPSWAEGSTATCLATDNIPFLTYGSKTAYELVRGKNGIADLPYCKPAQVWAFVRHGVHYAQPEDTKDFKRLAELQHKVIDNHKQGKGQLCPEDFRNLHDWKPLADDIDRCYHLTEEGKRDAYTLGSRVKVYFKDLFGTEKFSPEKFVFRASPVPMNSESMEAFYKGFFGVLPEQSLSLKFPEPDENDQLLYTFCPCYVTASVSGIPMRMLRHCLGETSGNSSNISLLTRSAAKEDLKYTNCPVWRDAMQNTQNERAKFIKSEYMTNVIKNANARLGFEKPALLKLSDVKAIYNVCRLNKAWDLQNISPWCAAFSADDLEVLEYAEDLGFYYRTGMGHDMNLALACPLANDLFTRFSKVEEQANSDNPLGVFYFGHSTLMYMLDARLGLTNNPPITAENFPQMRGRHFRTSQVAPFSGNIIAVLYKCSRGEPFRTMFYQAENTVDYPGCKKGVCDWKLIKQQFSQFTQEPVCLDTNWCSGIMETNNKAVDSNNSVNPDEEENPTLFYSIALILLFMLMGLMVLRNLGYV